MYICLDYLKILLYNFLGENMRLIEKSCPNCGAGIEIEENATSCKCDYCKRTYTIEKDKDEKKKFDPKNIKLSEMKTPMKAMFGSFIVTSIYMSIIGFIMFVAVVVFFIVILLQIISL